jgi:hypothetical protein
MMILQQLQETQTILKQAINSPDFWTHYKSFYMDE